MILKKSLLLAAFLFTLSSYCFAEGQQGIGLFIGFIYLLAIALLSLATGLVIWIISALINQKRRLSFGKSFAVGFILSTPIVLMGGIDVLFML